MQQASEDLPKIDIHTLEGLRRSLAAMTELYTERPHEVRSHVIRAKDRARYASRNARAAEEKRAVKEEMLEWMLVWLGDPAMFHTWVELRLKARGGS